MPMRTWCAAILWLCCWLGVGGASAQQLPRILAPNPAATYVLGANDRLRIIVFGEDNLSGEFRVDASGKVAFPLIGEVAAAGLDVRGFEQALQKRLSDGYLLDPRVSVEVLTARPFYILGEVENPGQYAFVPGMTAANAVATAGGFKVLADQRRVFIRRAGADQELETPLTPTTEIRPGDAIRVVKGSFYILGEVNRPGEYAYTPGMTVMQAVATAGGFTYRAARAKVFVKRADARDEERLKLVPTLTLEPGDTLRIGERFF